MKPALVIVDFGTTRIKFGALYEDGSFALVFVGFAPLVFPEPGAAIQNPTQIMRICIDGLKRCAETVASPHGIVLTGQMGGAIIVDPHAHARTPWFTAMDMRCEPFRQGLYERAGTRIRAISASQPIQAEILRWVANTGQAPAGSALLIPAFVATQLAREGMAAAYCERTCLGWTGLADVVAAGWDAELVAAADWSTDRLPRIVEPGSRVGHLSGFAAQLTGLPAELPLFAGPGDQAATLYGLGAHPGRTVDIAATFPVFTGASDRFFVPACERVEIMPSAVPGLWHPLGSFRGSGALPSWFSTSVAGAPMAELEAEARKIGPVTDIVAIPGGASGARNMQRTFFAGVDTAHGRAHLYRALLQGLACEYALIVEDLRGEGVELAMPVLAIGGGASSALLTALKAATTGLPWRTLSSTSTELTLAGAGLFVARTLGWTVDFAPEWSDVHTPDPAEVGPSQDILRQYRRWRRQLIDMQEA